MSVFSMHPSPEGRAEILRAAHRIMAKRNPIIKPGTYEPFTLEDAIRKAGDEIVQKLQKKGLRAAKRSKRGLEPEKKKKETKRQMEKRMKQEILASLSKNQGPSRSTLDPSLQDKTLHPKKPKMEK